MLHETRRVRGEKEWKDGKIIPLGNNAVDGLGNAIGMVVQAKMAQKHAAGQDESRRVGLVLALDVETDVSAARLENGHITTHVAAGNDTRATDERGTNVGQNATVQVGHHHDVKLLWARDGLHRGVVHNHVVDLKGGVLLGDVVESVAEQAIGQLHDVGLVDARHLGSAVGKGERKGKLGDALRLGARNDLERLDHSRHALVLQARVFALGVLTDDAQIDVLVAGLVAGNVLDQADAGVDIELLSHGDIETLVAGAADGRVQNALETELVALERSDRLAESVFSAASAVNHTRHLDLLPVYGHIVGLEDGLDRLGNLGTNAITGDQGHGVLAAKLGRLEDVGLNRREGSGNLVLASSAAQKLSRRATCQFVIPSPNSCPLPPSGARLIQAQKAIGARKGKAFSAQKNRCPQNTYLRRSSRATRQHCQKNHRRQRKLVEVS